MKKIFTIKQPTEKDTESMKAIQRNISALVSADPESRSKYAKSLFCPESGFL